MPTLVLPDLYIHTSLASPARRLMHLRSRLGELPPAEPWSYCAYSTSSLWRDKGILSGAMEFVGLRQAVACLPLRTGYTVYARGQMYTPMSYRGHWYTSKSGFAASLPNDELRPAGSSKDDASLDSPFYPDISSFMGSLEMDAAAPTMESLHNAEVEMELRETSDVWRETIQLAGQGDESVPHTRAHAFSSIATSVFHAASALQGDTEDAVLRAAASESVNSHGSSSMPSTGENDTITSLHGPFWQQMRRFSYAHRSRLGYQATSAAHGRRTFMSSPSARAMPAGPYELLNVSKSASAKEIKASYYDMVKALHPDRAQAQPATEKEKEMRLEKFRAVVKAYELLKDPKTRSMYDRYGMGWDTSPAGASGRSARNPWAPQNRPSTPAEWEHWYMWSEVLRRAPRGHRASWQYAAADEYTSNRFYGHPNMSKEEAEQRQRENMPLNQQIFAAIFTVTWIVAIFQLQRLNNIGMEHVEAANRHSAEAAKNLEMARQNARSVEGQLRQRALMERVRQAKQARERSSIEALPAPTPTQ